MRWWLRVGAARSLAATVVCCCVCVSAGKAIAGDDDEARVILFSGRDLWFNGAFAYGGMLWSPGGFDHEGFTFKALLSGGAYRYRADNLGGVTVIGYELAGQLMPGWRIKRGRFEGKFFFGPELQGNRLRPDDPDNRLRGRRVGVAFAADLWYEPTPAMMMALDGSLSSIATNYTARAAVGWKAFDMFYLGPETQVYGGDGYRQLRFGAHVTSFKTGTTEWSAAVGWAIGSDARDSAYLRLGFLQRQ
jgi:hypothetical protein